MNGKTIAAAKMRRHRGRILELLRINHQQQGSKLDDLELHTVLHDLKANIGRNQLKTLLQELERRRCVAFRTVRDRDTNDIDLREIEILPHGVDILEGTVDDPAIDVK